MGAFPSCFVSRLNNEYIALLSADDKIASEKFGELEKRIKNDRGRFVVMDIEDYESGKAGINCVNAAYNFNGKLY